MRAAVLAAIMRAPAPAPPPSPPPTGMLVGYNASGGDTYYNAAQTLLDQMFGALITSTFVSRNAAGYHNIAAGGVFSAHIFREASSPESMASFAGTYLVRVPVGFSAVFYGNMVAGSTNPSAGRYIVTLAAPTLTYEPAWNVGELAAVHFGISATNATGATAACEIVCMRTSHEAAYDAGKRWNPEFVEMLQTNSGGPIRMMDLCRANMGWVREIADIPEDWPHGPSPASKRLAITWEASAQPGELFRLSPTFDTANSGAYHLYVVQEYTAGASPELMAKLAVEANRPLHFHTSSTMKDETRLAYFNRLNASYPPGLSITIEDDNEPWNNGGGFLINYYRRGYYATQSSADGFSATDHAWADASPQMRANAHSALRSWKIARMVFGNSRVKKLLNCQVGWYDLSQYALNYVDAAGLIQTGAKAGDIAEYRAGGLYFGPTGGTAMVRPALVGRAWQDNAHTSGSAAEYWRTRLETGINTDLQGLINTWNAQAASGTMGQMNYVYEGWTHFDCAQAYFDVPAHELGQCVTANANGSLSPSSTTISGRAYAHAGETPATMWTDGDVAMVARSTGATAGVYFVKIVAQQLRIYDSAASYAANTPIAVPTGESMMLWNVSAIDALYGYLLTYCQQNTNGVVGTWLAMLAAKSIQVTCIFQPVGNANYFRSGGIYGAFRPWAVKQGGASQPATPAQTLFKTYA